jgi:hypothetical protein
MGMVHWRFVPTARRSPFPKTENDMHSPKTIILAQALISLMMAASMSGIMSLIAMGPTKEWLHAWPKHFIVAWPIAFCLSLVVSKVAFDIAVRLTSKERKSA